MKYGQLRSLARISTQCLSRHCSRIRDKLSLVGKLLISSLYFFKKKLCCFVSFSTTSTLTHLPSSDQSYNQLSLIFLIQISNSYICIYSMCFIQLKKLLFIQHLYQNKTNIICFSHNQKNSAHLTMQVKNNLSLRGFLFLFYFGIYVTILRHFLTPSYSVYRKLFVNGSWQAFANDQKLFLSQTLLSKHLLMKEGLEVDMTICPQWELTI